VFVGGMSGLFTVDKPVTAPGDLAGLRIRALDRTQVETLSALGAAPVKVPWEEIQAALQTGIAAGYLNPAGVALQFRHQRELRHFLALDMFPGFRFVTASTQWLDRQPPERLAALRASIARNADANFALVQARQSADLKQLAAQGITVRRLTGPARSAFARRAQSAYQELADARAVAQVRAMLAQHCRTEQP
jgi:TRAP-type C4-dicarboxylate transport system substrate-binding protein